MIRPTPAPKARYPKFIVVPYIYAAALVALVLVQLMGLGGFYFASIAYVTPGMPVLIVTIAAFEIFALPFLLRLPLSVLARFLSAVLSLVAPLFLYAHTLYLISEGMVAAHWYDYAGGIALILLGTISFMVLSGYQALRPARMKATKLKSHSLLK